MSDVQQAIEIAVKYGGIDGDHHKAWVIDQIVRTLTGCPLVTKQGLDFSGKTYDYKALGESAEYLQLIEDACAGDDGPDTYTWDVGVPP